MSQNQNRKNCHIIVYTDGAALGNPGPAAYAALLRYVCDGKQIASKIISGGFVKSTNNRAELWAVLKGLEAIKRVHIPVIVVSDSKYIVDSINKQWILKWKAENWKKRPNADLWQAILNQINRFNDISFIWTKGHSNDEFNNLVDKIANSFAQDIQSGRVKALSDPGFGETGKLL